MGEPLLATPIPESEREVYDAWLADLHQYAEHVDSRLELGRLKENDLRDGFLSGETTAEFGKRWVRKQRKLRRVGSWATFGFVLFFASCMPQGKGVGLLVAPVTATDSGTGATINVCLLVAGLLVFAWAAFEGVRQEGKDPPGS